MKHSKNRVLQIGAENFGKGGRSIIAQNLVKYMKKKYIVDFIAYSEYTESEVTKEIEKRGEIYKFTKAKGLSTINLIRKKKYDIVHIHADHSYEAMKSVIRSKFGGAKNIVVHAHTSGKKNYNILKKLVIEICKFFLPYFCSEMIACTSEAAIYMFGKKKKDKVRILKDGILVENYLYNTEKRQEIRNKLNIDEEDVVLGNVGRLSKEKNQIFLIKVLNYVLKKNNNFKLIIVGDGEEKNFLEGIVNSLNLEKKVKLLGNRNDVADILQAVDIFMFPSKYEGFGMAALEAQAAGLPTIISHTIPKDVKVTDLCYQCREDWSISEWIQIIKNVLPHLKNRQSNAKKAVEEIMNNGYNIRKSSEELELIYGGLLDEIDVR